MLNSNQLKKYQRNVQKKLNNIKLKLDSALKELNEKEQNFKKVLKIRLKEISRKKCG